MERIVEKLNARFELAEHEVRTGGSGKWFVYLKKDAIIRRLDSVVPMGWGTKIISSLRTNDRVEVVMEMTIKDITRSYDGVAEDNRRKGKGDKPEAWTKEDEKIWDKVWAEMRKKHWKGK